MSLSEVILHLNTIDRQDSQDLQERPKPIKLTTRTENSHKGDEEEAIVRDTLTVQSLVLVNPVNPV